jgi:hypothetical protein
MIIFHVPASASVLAGVKGDNGSLDGMDLVQLELIIENERRAAKSATPGIHFFCKVTA